MSDLSLSLTPCEGALVRVLGLIERRGYPVEAVRSHRGAGRIEMEIAIGRTARPLEVLARQLRRLHEVQEVRLQAEHPQFDLPAMPPRRDVQPQTRFPAPANRRGMSFLGLPERVSYPQPPAPTVASVAVHP